MPTRVQQRHTIKRASEAAYGGASAAGFVGDSGRTGGGSGGCGGGGFAALCGDSCGEEVGVVAL